MKIVHELSQLDYGGVERIVRSIIKYDKKNEHAIICYKDGPFRSKLEEVGAKIVIVDGTSEVDMDADVIHVHTGGSVSPLGKQLGKDFPVIETIHSPVRSAMPDDLVFKRVGVCEAVSRINANCMTIKNGIDINDQDDVMPCITTKQFDPKGKIVVGRVGRLGTDKGLEEWLLVCYHLQQLGYDFAPVIVGGEARDCDGYMGKLKLMADSLPVKNVTFVGHVDDPRPWFHAIDIFFYPSKTEGFGLVFAEALYRGCVVVASQTEVTSELFGGYTVLEPMGSGITGLVAAMRTVLDNPQLRDEFQSIGHDFIADEYQAEAMSLQYQELYDECCNGYPHKPGQDTKTNVVFAR